MGEGEIMRRDLDAVRDRVGGVSEAVRRATDQAVQGLIAGDAPALFRIQLEDLPINREVRAIDQVCQEILASPAASEVQRRFAVAVLRVNIALERIGDYAVTVARIGAHLNFPPTGSIAREIQRMAQLSLRILSLASRAFLRGDAELARETKDLDRKVDRSYEQAYSKLPAARLPIEEVVHLLSVFDRLERVSDQAKNICDEAIFVSTGQVKQPKRYGVLFVDRNNALCAPLAEAIAREEWAALGHFSSSNWEAAEDVSSKLGPILETLGLPARDASVRTLTTLQDPPHGPQVVVVLNAPDLPVQVPFRASLLRWEVPTDDLERTAEELKRRIAELMWILRGDA